jgi:hypothetical protein
MQTALEATGHADVLIGYRPISTSHEAKMTGFAGSPTITVDGVDLFPSAGQTEVLACRIYPTPAGLARLPTVEQIWDALVS